MLAQHTTDPALRDQVNGLAQQLVHSGIGAADAKTHAYGLLYRSMQAQAQTLAYIDTYMLLSIGASIMFVLAFIVKKNDPGGGAVIME